MAVRMATRMIVASVLATAVGLFAFAGYRSSSDVLSTGSDVIPPIDDAAVSDVAEPDDELDAADPSTADPDADPTDGVVIDISGPGRPTDVAMVGDSLTVGATPYLEEEYAILGLDVVTIDAQVGRRMDVRSGRLDSGVQIIEQVESESDPELWVVALGTNDVGKYSTAEDYLAQIDAVLTQIPAETPLVWIDTWLRDDADDAAEFNELLRDRLGDRPETHVVDWYQYGDDDGVISGDGVHPTPRGAAVFAQVVAFGVIELVTAR